MLIVLLYLAVGTLVGLLQVYAKLTNQEEEAGWLSVFWQFITGLIGWPLWVVIFVFVGLIIIIKLIGLVIFLVGVGFVIVGAIKLSGIVVVIGLLLILLSIVGSSVAKS